MDEHPDLARLQSRRPSAAADAVARVLDPLVVLSATMLLVSVATVAPVTAALGWAALGTVFCALIPEVALRRQVRRGLAADRQLVVREHRHTPVLVAAVSVVTGILVLWVLDAPAPVRAVVATAFAGVVVMGVVTRFWKASFHAAVCASSTVVCGAVWGAPAAVGIGVVGTGLVTLVGWARVRAGRHSVAQVVGGGLLGAAVAAVVFPAVR